MRSIGVRTYTANQKIVDDKVKDETIETNLAEDEVAAFKKDWEDNWHPMIGEQSTGIMKTFFPITCFGTRKVDVQRNIFFCKFLCFSFEVIKSFNRVFLQHFQRFIGKA